jgi:hypothetical protein
MELDPEWTKRQLFGKYCFNLGYSVKQTVSGAITINLQVDKEWVTRGAEKGLHCLWATFFTIRKGNTPILLSIDLARTFAVFVINST